MAASSKDYIPRPDADFASWVNAYAEALVDFWVKQGLPIIDLKAFKLAVDAFQLAFAANVSAQAAAEGARESKDAARAELEGLVRPLAAFVQSFPKTSNADRARMGITVRGSAALPSRAPTTRPLAQVESGQRLTHRLRLVDESTPTRRARPRGTLGAEVWVKLVDPGEPAPTNPAELAFLALATTGPLRADFHPGQGGKTAVYMARWVSSRGEKGPWSEICSATVAA